MFYAIFKDIEENSSVTNNTKITLEIANTLMDLYETSRSKYKDIEDKPFRIFWSQELSDDEIFACLDQNIQNYSEEDFSEYILDPVGFFFITPFEITRFVNLICDYLKVDSLKKVKYLSRCDKLSVTRCSIDRAALLDFNFENKTKGQTAIEIFSKLRDEKNPLTKNGDLFKIVRRWQSCGQLSSYTHKGDGYVDCLGCGKKHWGKNGASGLLVARVDEQNNVTHILLQLRSFSVSNGVCWCSPSGAISDGEDPLESACREAYEESNITPDNIFVVDKIFRDHKNWSFTSYLCIEDKKNPIDYKIKDSESLDIRWVSVKELKNYELLGHLEDEIDGAIERIEKVLKN